MNKVLDELSTIIVINIVVISIIIISSNFGKALQHKYYLKIDSNNREYIEDILQKDYKLIGTLDKIACMQGLGDWYLFLYYEDGMEDETIFSDSNREVQPLHSYITNNGYNEGEASWNKIKVSFWLSLVAIIYEVSYLVIKKIKRKQPIKQFE